MGDIADMINVVLLGDRKMPKRTKNHLNVRIKDENGEGDFVISSDQYGFSVYKAMVKKEGDNIGEEYQVTVGHAANFENVIGLILDNKMRVPNEEITSLKQYCEYLKSLEEEFKGLMKEIKEGFGK